MKRFSAFGLLVLLALLGTVQHASAIAVTTNVNEFGQGTTTFPNPNNPPLALPSLLGADPTGGLGGPVLTYLLPYAPVSGELRINEVIGATVVLSDIIRFTGTMMIFYSDNGDGVDAPADTGLPGNVFTTNIILDLLEVGTEGANGLVFAPLPGNPGYINSDFLVTYNITSDSAIPEPRSVLLIAAGIASLGLFRKLQNR